jgi:hypothetical protein
MPTKHKPREVREAILPKTLLKGFTKFKDFAAMDVALSAVYMAERVFDEPGDLATYIAKLQRVLRNAKAAGYTRVDLEVNHYSDDCGGHGTDIDVTFIGWRPETRDERLERQRVSRAKSKAAQIAAATRKLRYAARERKEYERLKQKFEGKPRQNRGKR